MTEPPSPNKSDGPADKPAAQKPPQANPGVANPNVIGPRPLEAASAATPVRPIPPVPPGPRPAAGPASSGTLPGPARIAPAPSARETVPPAPAPRSGALPLLYLLGFAILAAAIGWIWTNPPLPPEAPVGALQARLDTLEAEVARLSARPVPTTPAPAPTFDPAPLLARIAALEGRGTPAAPSLAPIDARLAALEARPEAGAADASLTGRVARIAAIQSAAVALETGHPVGKLPDAPPALQRFATADPPTEAGLRLSFPAQARAALIASRPIDPGLPWLSRIWGRLQELITIRQGEHVLVGDPAAGVIATAQRALDAGDLAGAVTALGRLNPPAAAAIAGWTEQAKSLLEARAALAAMAAHS